MVKIKEAIQFLENTLYLGEEDDMLPHKAKYNYWIKEIIKILKRRIL